MPLSERKKAHQDDAPQSVHNLTEVSKNAFVEPFSAPQNYVTNHPREFTQQPNLVLHFCGAWVYRQSNACIRIIDTGINISCFLWAFLCFLPVVLLHCQSHYYCCSDLNLKWIRKE